MFRMIWLTICGHTLVTNRCMKSFLFQFGCNKVGELYVIVKLFICMMKLLFLLCHMQFCENLTTKAVRTTIGSCGWPQRSINVGRSRTTAFEPSQRDKT